MSRQVCGGCGGMFAYGFFACPHCGDVAVPSSTGRMEEAMPRITVAGGPSNPDAAPGEVGYVGPEPDAAPVVEAGGEPVPEPALPEGWTTAPAPAPDYTSMTQAALRDEAKTRGLPVGGSKADLAQRLTDHDAVQAAEQQEADA